MNYELIESLGWVLLHSVWQIALVAMLLLVFLRAFAETSTRVRYGVSVFALGISLALSVATFVVMNRNTTVTIQTNSVGVTGVVQKEQPYMPSEQPLLMGDSEVTDTALGYVNLIKAESLTPQMPWLVAVWLFGVAVFSLRMFGGLWQLRIYKTRNIVALENGWQERFDVLRARLEISQPVRLLRSTLVETPIVAGWLKPVILVPASVFLQIDLRELETIIAHELVHIRRRDYLVNFAQNLMEILFFYHPCVWWISAQIRREREFVCDDIVTQTLRGERIVYARALANLEELRLLTNGRMPSASPAIGAIGAANGGNLMVRIQRILQKNTEVKGNPSAWSAMLGFAFISALLLCVFSVTDVLVVNAQKSTKDKKIAIGFVSLPPIDRSNDAPKDADATARLVIAALGKHKVPAVGFVNGTNISDGEKFYLVRANIVRLWRDAGLEVGIGNFKHIKFFDTPYDEYVAGVEKNETVVRKLLAEKNLPLKYFSYPFLNTGKSTEEKVRFEAWLKTRTLRSIPYTIDNQEWVYSYAYDTARMDNDVNTMAEVRVEFIKYMEQMFDHYEAYSQDMFGRQIAQTMVLKPSRLVADSSDDLFGMIQRRGYKFVSMDEALKDEAYNTQENFVGSAGISWFERWTMKQGKPLRDEPRVDASVWNIWEARNPGK